jgi:hypothetical protein
MSYGPYAKGLPFQVGYPDQWNRMAAAHPDVISGSSNRYQNWEVVDPEKWVPEGYVCVRVDSRGAGRSPGFIDPFSPRETRDLFECIEWAAAQPWSSGKVGLNGVSYYAINQWHVASLQPPHLAAICVWEGAADFYRDMTYHGGIQSTFFANWYDRQVRTVQHGLGSRGPGPSINGLEVCGDDELGEHELVGARTDFGAEIANHPLDGPYHRNRSPVFERITTPLLSAGNWGGHGLHLRGNVEGFTEAASKHKWLELHGLEHWTHFYTDYGRELQLEFFDHFLKGIDNGWDRRPPVLLNVRHVDHFETREAGSWPLPETKWTRLFLHADARLTSTRSASSWEVEYGSLTAGVTFFTPSLQEEVEITGPAAARLWAASSTTDMDLFLVLRLFDPDGGEVTFQGALDPRSPLAHGWLRASHRQLDPLRSRPWRPYHTHTDHDPLTPGEVYELEVEIWPTSIVVPKGYRLGLTIRGSDYRYEGSKPADLISTFKSPLTGVGPFLHDDPMDRPVGVFGGKTTIYGGPQRQSSVMVPLISGKL